MCFLFTFLLFAFLNVCKSRSLSEVEWTLLETGPWGSREGLMGVYYEGYVYMSGGRYSPDGFRNIDKSVFYNDVWKIDATCVATNTTNNCKWTEIQPNAQWEGRAYHIMFMHTVDNIDYFYIIGGQNLTYFYGDVWRSTDAITWTLIKEDNTYFHNRAGLAAVGNTLEGNIYMCCGCYNESSNRVVYNDLWSSKDGETWTPVLSEGEAPFEPRSGPRMQYYNDTLYLVAGEDGFHERTQFGDVWKYELYNKNVNNNWILVNPHAFLNRSGHGFSIDNKTGAFYVVAGYLDLHDLLRSVDYGIKWETIDHNVFNCNVSVNDCGRFDFWSLVDDVDNTFWIYGGSSSWSTFGNLHNQTYRVSLSEYK